MTAAEDRAKAKEIADALPLVEATFRHPSLAAALVAGLADLTTVEKDQTAEVPMKAGGSYSYSYADLEAIVKRTRPVLAAHGIVALTPVHDHGNGLACTVKLIHEGGETMDLGPFPFPHGKDAQATGSMVTYHRRYALVAALGMATGDDDDGASAVAAAPAFVWTAGAVKARLLELLPSKDAAVEAWRNGHGDDLTEWSSAVADRLAKDWLDNQPVEEGDPGPESE